MLELDFEFHRTIVEMSGNRRLLDTWLKLEVQTRLFLKMTDQFHHDLRNLVSIHEPIAEAVIAGNADQAFALASHHSEPDGTRLAKTIAATGDPKEETQKLRSSRG
jgi:DNA-binding GntR family transcriptional regulator